MAVAWLTYLQALYQIFANLFFSKPAPPPLSSAPDTEPASSVPSASSAFNTDMDMDAKAKLERQYIELLEKRVAQLEALVNSAPKGNAAKPTKDPAKGDSKAAEPKGPVGATKKVQKEGSRFRNVISRWDTKVGKRADYPVEKPPPESKPGDDGKAQEAYAFTFRRVMDYSDPRKLAYSEIELHSKDLKDLLKEVIGGDHPGQRWNAKTINMVAKFSPIVHNWDKLKDASTKQEEGDSKERKLAREDLRQLLHQVETCSELEAYFRTRKSSLDSKTITFENLWTLFPPKTKVFAKPFMGLPQVFQVKTPPDQGEKEVMIKCWGYDCGGKNWVEVHFEFPIEKFLGARDINSLFCYPLIYYKNEAGEYNSKKLEDELIERGRLFHNLYRAGGGAKQMFDYDNLVLSQGPGTSLSSLDKSSGKSRPQTDPKIANVKGRFMVDAAAFLQFGPGNPLLGGFVPKRVEESGPIELADVIEKDQYLCCPPRVLGYATKSRTWGQFKVEETRVVKKEEVARAFEEKLVLDPPLKKMISALVGSHESGKKLEGSATVNDVVGGKGKSLIILLHGPPGVGKTLTAETIAEKTGKPLFIASVAEVGLDASKAERNLEQMFHLASAWEAILLIDEADVFLESRARDGDPNRNALVSVFLRALEYYQGIMILTTNRITSLDMAVQSRIHLAIRYQDLDKEQMKHIFDMFLSQLSGIPTDERKAINDWVAEDAPGYNLNGRQIRNVISSAQALARSEGKTLNLRHIKNVMKITQSFQEQLRDLTMAARGVNEVQSNRRW